MLISMEKILWNTLIILGLMFWLGMIYIGIMAILCRYIPFMMAFGIELFMTIFIPLVYIYKLKTKRKGIKMEKIKVLIKYLLLVLLEVIALSLVGVGMLIGIASVYYLVFLLMDFILEIFISSALATTIAAFIAMGLLLLMIIYFEEKNKKEDD